MHSEYLLTFTESEIDYSTYPGCDTSRHVYKFLDTLHKKCNTIIPQNMNLNQCEMTHS